ncbi:ISAs1 family transposase [Turicimonas muris]|uniref:ISAs1 family transposase n=1 Tax=Turicimonas muris TaxID=1796652 RepID=UPI0024088950|nr:ISAs1 family transposase [Turicimonas muris]
MFHDTVRHITVIIGKDKNSVLINQFVQILQSRLSHPVVAVDGQAVRASRNKFEHSPYVLKIMDTNNEIILARLVIAEKKSEITCASKLISTLDISGVITTADALNTQREFAAQIIESKADYSLALKKNQDLIYKQVCDVFELGSHDYKSAATSVTDKGEKSSNERRRFCCLIYS